MVISNYVSRQKTQKKIEVLTNLPTTILEI
jgi:hypothetical protein